MSDQGDADQERRSARTRANRGTLRSLGLGRIGKSNELKESPELDGKLRKVAHLIKVEDR